MDAESIRLQKTAQGEGNSLSTSARFLLSSRHLLESAGEPFYRIEKKPDGTLGVKPANFAELEALPESALDARHYVVRKDWQDRVPPQYMDSADPFELKLQHYASFSDEEKAQELAAIRKSMEIIRKNTMPPMEKARAIMDAVEDVFILNKSALKTVKSEVGINQRTVAKETGSFVSEVLAAVDESKLTSALMDCFAFLSKGQSINHISRVFSMMISFMLHFNFLHQTGSWQKVRIAFKERYKDQYRMLFPTLDDAYLTLDNMVQLSLIDSLDKKEWALGAFLHDIGKMANLDYFESDAAYDANEIRQHVYLGSGLILMNYGTDHEDARIIAGDHHNALFHKDGYSVTRWEREKGIRKLKECSISISSQVNDYLSGEALGFLPVEMLAVVDIYDALTDASRAYKKPMTSLEALQFMHGKLVGQSKLDPVMVDIFADFLKTQGVAVPDVLGLPGRP